MSNVIDCVKAETKIMFDLSEKMATELMGRPNFIDGAKLRPLLQELNLAFFDATDFGVEVSGTYTLNHEREAGGSYVQFKVVLTYPLYLTDTFDVEGFVSERLDTMEVPRWVTVFGVSTTNDLDN